MHSFYTQTYFTLGSFGPDANNFMPFCPGIPGGPLSPYKRATQTNLNT